MLLTLQPITFFHKGSENSKQLQSFHVVFGRACGATLTTLSAKKIPLSSAVSMLQSALCLLDCAVWGHHLAFCALELIFETFQAAV